MKKLLLYFSYLVIGLIPLEALEISENAGITFGRLVFIGLCFCAFFSYKSIKKEERKQPHIICLAIFVVYAALSILWSINQEETLHRCMLLMQYLIITVIVTIEINTPKRFFYLIVSFCIGCLFISINSVLDYSTTAYSYLEADQGYRVTGFGNPNENAFLLNYSLILTILLRKYVESKKMKLIVLFYIVIVMIAILTTGSRNGFIMLTVILFFSLFPQIKRIKIKSLLFIFTIIFTLAYTISHLPQKMTERYLTIDSEIKGGSLSSRRDIWNNAMKIVQENDFNFLIGKGWGTFNYGYAQYTGVIRGAHNFYISTYYTLGLIGIILLFIYFIILIKYIYQIREKEKFIYFLLILIPLISMATTNWESRKWWFIISIFIYKFYELSICCQSKKIELWKK